MFDANGDLSFPFFVAGMMLMVCLPFIIYGVWAILKTKSCQKQELSGKTFATTKFHPLTPPDKEIDVTGMSGDDIQGIVAMKCFNPGHMMVGNVIDRDGKQFLQIEYCG